LSSCQDSKKEDATPIKTTKETPQVDKQSKEVELKEDSTPKYPKITDKNVEQFFEAYGKDNPETKVLIETTYGDIYLELFKDTPLHRANFIFLVKQGYFNDTFFHRVVPNFIIQAGNSDLASTPKKRKKIGKYRLPAELESGRKHGYGTVSGAKRYRKNPDKKSAPFEFFIFLGPLTSTSHLNGNYTIFAKVTKGMDVVEKIAKVPADKGEWPKTNIYISASVLE